MIFSFDLSYLGFDNFIKYVSLCLLLNLQSFQLWFFWVHFQPYCFYFLLPGLWWQNCQLFYKSLTTLSVSPYSVLSRMGIFHCPKSSWPISSFVLFNGFQAIEIFVLFFLLLLLLFFFLHRLLYFSVKKNPFRFSLNPLSFLEAFYFLLFLLQDVHNCLVKHFYDLWIFKQIFFMIFTWKLQSGHSNIFGILVLISLYCIPVTQVEIFLVLDIMNNFLLKTGHCQYYATLNPTLNPF